MSIPAKKFQPTVAVAQPLSRAPQAANSGATALNAARKASGPPTVAVIKKNLV